MVRKELAFEREFVAAGGKLLAGVDPTGWGGVVAGFGDQREVELLVEAGFSPERAIRIATSNGAAFLNQRDFGTIEPGARADLVILEGASGTTRDANERLFDDSRAVRKRSELTNREALIRTLRQPLDDAVLDRRVRSTPARRSSRALPE